MSMSLMVKAMSIKTGNPLRKLILLKLADNASDKGECWPSYQHIADQCEVSKSTVKKHIKHLESMRLLRLEHRDGPKGNSSNLYHLTLQGEVADNPGGGSSDDIGGSSDNPGGGSSDDTRTSNSLEPVNEPRNDYSKVKDIFNKYFAHGLDPITGEKLLSAEVKQITDKRKKIIDTFFKKTGLDLQKFEYYIEHVATQPSWLYFRKKNVRNGVTYDRRPFEYYMTLDNYVKASEENSNNG